MKAVKMRKSLWTLSRRRFHGSDIGSFFQQKPVLRNTYENDSYLKQTLRRTLPKEVMDSIEEDLNEFGQKVVSVIEPLGEECEKFPPKLTQYDAWGNRVDKLETCQAWKTMKSISATDGLIATAYEKSHHQWSRIHQMMKMYLFNPSSGLYSCPLAMTDGAAKILEKFKYDDPFKSAYSKLTSTCPHQFWTSGQWMTERKGGSDVAGGTETIARVISDGKYRLNGYKWFSSATDSDMALTLARIADGNDTVKAGTKGLSLFYLETRNSDGQLNNIQVEKLKNKLGTRQLPTAELLLNGTEAYRLFDEGRGIAGISSMLTLTRIHNAVSSVSTMRRILMLSSDYSRRRQAFGSFICDSHLHVQTLARMELETRGSLLLLVKLLLWLGLDDCGQAKSCDTLMLRLMTPIIKLYTAKQAVSIASEGLESFGGQGYIEDTGLPKYLRDSQVLPIWEGTTNMLSLDVLRCIKKSNGEVLDAFKSDVIQMLRPAETCPKLKQARENVTTSLSSTLMFVSEYPNHLEVAARDLAYSLARIYIGALFIQQSCFDSSDDEDISSAIRWCCCQSLSPVVENQKLRNYDADSIKFERKLIYPKQHS